MTDNFGYCLRCQSVHILPSVRAVPYCHQLMGQLCKYGRLDFEVSEGNPLFSTDMLYGDSSGKMFGVLVCENEVGEEIVLRAFSCQYNGAWHIKGWVPPIMDTARFDAMASRASAEIHRLNKMAHDFPGESVERKGFILQRREVSKKLVRDLRELYVLRNFRGEIRSLEDAFIGRCGIPWGTGDCCAPKLLQEAVMRGYRPKAMAEFFWGRSNSSGIRKEGSFYPSCEERCQPILGFMLCGGMDAV